MDPINVMLIMKHLLLMVYTVCVTSAALHFDRMALLAWYILILVIYNPIAVRKKGE
jgi:hypothetical protein